MINAPSPDHFRITVSWTVLHRCAFAIADVALCLGPCSVLMPDENKERFVKSEGVELMIIVIRQKRQAYASAFKTLDFALTRCPSACDRFVTVQGLKTLFAAFMGKVRATGSGHHKARGIVRLACF